MAVDSVSQDKPVEQRDAEKSGNHDSFQCRIRVFRKPQKRQGETEQINRAYIIAKRKKKLGLRF